MSRTYNTRPQWVKLNDPKFPTRESHQHHVVQSKKIGEGKYIHTPAYVERDENGRVVWRQEERSWPISLYARWTENVPCTIDLPERPWRESRNYSEKRCDKRPLIGYGCSCCSRRFAKKLSSQAQRATINQQLHNAVRDYGRSADPDNWYDVDINHMSVNEDWKWWD